MEQATGKFRYYQFKPGLDLPPKLRKYTIWAAWSDDVIKGSICIIPCRKDGSSCTFGQTADYMDWVPLTWLEEVTLPRIR